MSRLYTSARRFLCWLLSFTMLLSPQALAEQPDLGLGEGNSYVMPQPCAVVSINPHAILNSPACHLLPIEVLQAASIQHLGLDALQIERVVFSIESPQVVPPNYSLVGAYPEAIPGKLTPQVTAAFTPAQLNGRPLMRAAHPATPSLYFPTDKILVAAPEPTYSKLGDNATSAEPSGLVKSLAESREDDLFASVDFVQLRPLVNMALMQKGLPDELAEFYLAPNLIKTITLRVNVSRPSITELFVEANNGEDAESLLGIVQKTVDMMIAAARKESDALLQNPDPVQQALGRYQQRMMDGMKGQFLPEVDGAQLTIFRRQMAEGNDEQTGLVFMATTGILVALLLPAVQAAREAARRNTSMNNMKQLMLALLNYESANGHFPAYASFDANGKPLLSWRVHILPFLEQQALYAQFHLDEPWDSEHNKALVSKMPAIFVDPSSSLAPENGKTHYLGVKGQGMVFNGTAEGLKIRDITDGLSNTIMLLQTNDAGAVEWTKPDDLEWNEKQPLAGLLPPLHPGIFNAAFVDGHISAISTTIDPTAFKHLLTIAGGEPVP